MATNSPTAAAFLRKTARWCRDAASNVSGDVTSEKFLALAADLDIKAAQIERHGGNGSA
jgi:hypothetical protein